MFNILLKLMIQLENISGHIQVSFNLNPSFWCWHYFYSHTKFLKLILTCYIKSWKCNFSAMVYSSKMKYQLLDTIWGYSKNELLA